MASVHMYVSGPNIEHRSTLIFLFRNTNTVSNTTRTSTRARNAQNPPNGFNAVPNGGVVAARLLASDALFQQPLFRRPLAVVFPALHQRSRHNQEIYRHTRIARLQDNLTVDLGICVWRDSSPDGMVG